MTHVPWNNNDNNNTEFEGGQQNMMGFSCMKAVYEYTSYLNGIKNYRCLTRKPATRKKKYYKEMPRSDPIRCVAVMKLARAVFAYTERKYSLRYFWLFMLHICTK